MQTHEAPAGERRQIALHEEGHERALSRHSAEFVLRALRSVSKVYGGDLILAIVAIEIIAANTGHLATISSEPFGAIDTPVPDNLRRPVSALAIAGALGVPRETARRYVKRLQAMGVCEKVGGGYIIPAAFLASPANLEVIRENVANLRRLVDRLRDADALR
jgi:hypothetical protein